MTPKLPIELLLNVLDQLVGSTQPIFAPSHPVTKTLRALTLTSRTINPIATKYLYSYCLYLGNHINYTCLRRTLKLNIGSNHPQSLVTAQAERNETSWNTAKTPQYITSIFISPKQDSPGLDPHRWPPLHEELLDLWALIGSTLKRLVLNTTPRSHSDLEKRKLLQPNNNNIVLALPALVELITNASIIDSTCLLPPNLQRLAITLHNPSDAALAFCFSSPALETLVLPRPEHLSARDITGIFTTYKGQSLDIVFVDVNSNHRTPEYTRDWVENDAVKIWEVDVPTSFYGDDGEKDLCDAWIWGRALEGRIWGVAGRRRMVEWREVERRLAGPVHGVAGDVWG